MKEQLDSYVGAHFIKPDGAIDTTTNTVRISSIMEQNGFVSDGKKHVYKDMFIFPVDYFCPRQTTGEMLFSENTYCDHHFMGSWGDDKKRRSLLRLLGQKNLTRHIKLKRKIVG